MAGFDVDTFFDVQTELLPIGAMGQWKARCIQLPALNVLSPLLVPVLRTKLPRLMGESSLCETLKRRAAALAFDAERLARLPKGKFKASDFLAEDEVRLRSLMTAHTLQTVAGCVTDQALRVSVDMASPYFKELCLLCGLNT